MALDLSAQPRGSVIRALPLCPAPLALKLGAGPNRMSYPREFKLMVIDYFHAHGANKYRTCKEFQITKSMLNGWLSKIEKIRESRPGSLKSGRSGRRPQFPDVEKQLFDIYTKAVWSGQRVGNRWIRETARGLAAAQCSREELGGMCQFSERWLANFKKRYGINLNKDWSSGASDAVSSSSASDTAALPKEEPADDESESEAAVSSSSPVAAPVPLRPPTLSAPLLNPEPALLPVAAFYRQYPWLARPEQPPPPAYEPGRRGRKVQFPQVEKVLYERLLQRQAEGQRISNRWLQETARALAQQLCPEVLAIATRSARCLFSEHWLHNFKKRYGLTLKGQRLASPPSTPASEPSPPPAAEPAQLLQQWQHWLLQSAYMHALLPQPQLNLAEWYNKAESRPTEEMPTQVP